MTSFDPSAPWSIVIAAVAGAVLGWLLDLLVKRWLDGYEAEVLPVEERRSSPVSVRIAVAGGAVIAAMLWGWEVWGRGLESADLATPDDAGGTVLRWGAHLGLFWLLAAATWIDFRHRVIPDWITIPGTLFGLVAVWCAPSILLPVAAEVARSFAAPAFVPDVLGWAGPLRRFVADAAWGTPAPLLALPAALVCFLAWWRVATAPNDPFAEEAEAVGSGPDGGGSASADGSRRTPDRRGLVLLLAGMAAIGAAWAAGGGRFGGLLTGLVGVAVSGGIVWLTRAGASLALRREAMGLGDVTLMAMVGAWLGWQACVLACFVGVIVGLCHGLVQIARHRESELPFGPSLCAGTAAVVIAWQPFWRSTAETFGQPGQLAAVVGGVVGGTAVTLAVWSGLAPAARRIVLTLAVVATILLVVWLMLLAGPNG